MKHVKGAESVEAMLRKLGSDAINGDVGAAVFVGADIIRAEAGRLITEGATSGKHHTPSAPHHPPNEDSGFLRSHIVAVQTGPLSAEVAATAPYSQALEYGTSKMIERPFMSPAARSKRKAVTALVRKAVREAIRTTRR